MREAVELLGQYFFDSGLGEWQYVSGVMALGDGIQSHAWVEQEGLIVDITADQFDGVAQATLATLCRAWAQRPIITGNIGYVGDLQPAFRGGGKPWIWAHVLGHHADGWADTASASPAAIGSS